MYRIGTKLIIDATKPPPSDAEARARFERAKQAVEQAEADVQRTGAARLELRNQDAVILFQLRRHLRHMRVLEATGGHDHLARVDRAVGRLDQVAITIGSNTDPYQPIERRYRIMRRILEILSATNHPVGIVTKSALVLRDLDILSSMAERGLVKVALSVHDTQSVVELVASRELELGTFWHDELPEARVSATFPLNGVPGTESLAVWRMRAFAAGGDIAGVRSNSSVGWVIVR